MVQQLRAPCGIPRPERDQQRRKMLRRRHRLPRMRRSFVIANQRLQIPRLQLLRQPLVKLHGPQLRHWIISIQFPQIVHRPATANDQHLLLP
ncbi:hypothetical protein D3C85_1756390 [compost metagenome]